jgi:hypothetical protein
MTMAKTATEIGATTPICPNAFPAVAAKTPNKANAEANPTANAIAFDRIADFFASSSSSSFSFSASEAYPPMYPNVSGNTDSVHGDKLVTNPATKTNANVAGDAPPAEIKLNAPPPTVVLSIMNPFSPLFPPNAPDTNPSNPDVASNSDFEKTSSDATVAISRISCGEIIIVVVIAFVLLFLFLVEDKRNDDDDDDDIKALLPAVLPFLFCVSRVGEVVVVVVVVVVVDAFLLCLTPEWIAEDAIGGCIRDIFSVVFSCKVRACVVELVLSLSFTA